MKKIILAILALVVCASMAACGGTPASSEASSVSSETSSVSSEASSVSSEASSVSSEASSSSSEASSSSSEASSSSSEAASSSAAPAAGSTAVSDNIFDNQFSFGGTVVTLPTAVKTFEPFGLVVPADKGDVTLAKNYTTGGSIKSADGKQSIFGSFYNTGDAAVSLSDAMMSSTNIKKQYFPDTEIIFAKGITFGATIDEVKAAWGEPTEFLAGDAKAKVLRDTMFYKNPEMPVHNKYELAFEDGKLVGVNILVNEK